MLGRSITAILFLALITLSAAAQVAPFVHGGTVGTSPVQALPDNQLRRKIYLFNPNASASLAFCPIGPNRDTGAAVTCAINGAGSITLLPAAGLMVDGGIASGPPLSMRSAWNVVASAGSSAWTILEFE